MTQWYMYPPNPSCTKYLFWVVLVPFHTDRVSFIFCVLNIDNDGDKSREEQATNYVIVSFFFLYSPAHIVQRTDFEEYLH